MNKAALGLQAADHRTRPAGNPGRLPPGLPEDCVWLAEGMVPLSGRQVGLVPGAEAPLLALSLPERLRGLVREQVGFRQLRDTLGETALDLRPFGGGPSRGPWRRVLAADRDAAARWRALAGAGGRAVLPDYLALPAAEGLWVLAPAAEGLLARLGPEDGFSAPRPLALRQVQAALEAGPAPRAVLLTAADPEIAALFAARGISVTQDADRLVRYDIAAPKHFAFGELEADLRRDPGAARAALARRVLPWRWPVLAGLVAVVFWAAAQMLAIDRLAARESALRDDTLARVRDSFVPAGPILDIRAQVGRALTAAEAAAGARDGQVSPLDLFERAAEVMHRSGATPQSLNYTRAEGLAAVVQVADFAAADALTEALRDTGLEVQLVEARAEDGTGGVRAELRLTLQPEGR